MTQYLNPTFSVPCGERDPKNCEHGWIDARGRCTFCGEKPKPTEEKPSARTD